MQHSKPQAPSRLQSYIRHQAATQPLPTPPGILARIRAAITGRSSWTPTYVPHQSVTPRRTPDQQQHTTHDTGHATDSIHTGVSA